MGYTNIFFAKVLKHTIKANHRTVRQTKLEVHNEMKCSDCNSEMKLDKEFSYMTQYRCDVCRRVETLWMVCVAA